MRSLALLLLLMNLSLFVWQLGFLPWIPWQPAQFASVIVPEIATTDLPTLHLLHENISTPTNVEVSSVVATPTTSSVQVTVEKIGEKQENTAETADIVKTEAQQEENDSSQIMKLGFFSHLAISNMNRALSNAQNKISALQEATSKNTVRSLSVASGMSDDTQTTSSSTRCYDIGPYQKKEAIKQTADWFKTQATSASTTIEARETPTVYSTKVYLPPYKTKQAAREVEKRLTQQNISDKMIIKQGQLANGISLGVYRDELSVERRLKQLKEKGYTNVRTEKMYRTRTTYWLNVKMGAEGAVELSKNFEKAQKAPPITLTQCK